MKRFNLTTRQPHSQALLECEYVSHGEPGIFSTDVIEIGLKQKGNVLHVVQQTMHSMLGVYDIQPPITRYM